MRLMATPGFYFSKWIFWWGSIQKTIKTGIFILLPRGNSIVELQSSGYSNGFLGTHHEPNFYYLTRTHQKWCMYLGRPNPRGKSKENPTYFLPDPNPTFELDVEQIQMNCSILPPFYVGLSFQLDKRPHDLLEAIKCTMWVYVGIFFFFDIKKYNEVPSLVILIAV